MPVTLVWEDDRRSIERLRYLAGAAGWQVKVVDDLAGIEQGLETFQPRLLLIGSGQPGAANALARFARAASGCGAVALVPEADSETAEQMRAIADEVLLTPPSYDDVRELVRRWQTGKAAEHDRGAGDDPAAVAPSAAGDEPPVELPVEPTDEPSEDEETSEPEAAAEDLASPERASERAETGSVETLEAQGSELDSGELVGSAELAPLEIPKPETPEPEIAEPGIPEPDILEPGILEPEAPDPDTFELEATVPEPPTDQPLESEAPALETHDLEAPELETPEPETPEPETLESGTPAIEPASIESEALDLEGPDLEAPVAEPEADDGDAIEPPLSSADLFGDLVDEAAELDQQPEPEIGLPEPGLQDVDASPDGIAGPSRSAAADSPPAGTGFGSYVLDELLSTTATTEIWAARRRSAERLGKRVLVERVRGELAQDDEAVAVLAERVKRAAPLTHNGIVQIFDLGTVEGRLYVAGEAIKGPTLAQIFAALDAAGERLPERIAVLICLRVANALRHAHERRDLAGRSLSTVHGAVEPGRVHVSLHGEVKLSGFGIGCAPGPAPHVGDDLRALGRLLRDCLVGPLSDHNDEAGIDRERAEPPPRLAQLVDELLAADGHSGMRSMAEAVDRLERSLTQLGAFPGPAHLRRYVAQLPAVAGGDNDGADPGGLDRGDGEIGKRARGEGETTSRRVRSASAGSSTAVFPAAEKVASAAPVPAAEPPSREVAPVVSLEEFLAPASAVDQTSATPRSAPTRFGGEAKPRPPFGGHLGYAVLALLTIVLLAILVVFFVGRERRPERFPHALGSQAVGSPLSGSPQWPYRLVNGLPPQYPEPSESWRAVACRDYTPRGSLPRHSAGRRSLAPERFGRG